MTLWGSIFPGGLRFPLMGMIRKSRAQATSLRGTRSSPSMAYRPSEAAKAFPIGTKMHVQPISAAVLCKQRAFGPSSSASPAGPATSLLETREQPGSVLPAAQPFEWPTPDPPSPPIHEKSSPISQSLKSATVVTAGSVVISGHARKLPAAAAATGRSHAKRQLIANAYAGIGGDDGRMNVDEPGPKPAQVLKPSQPAPTSRAAQLRWLESTFEV